MKTYLRNHKITEADVWDAYCAWLSGESGRKNSHRVEEEYGTAGALVHEIADETRTRSLRFRPIHRYRRYEASVRKVRLIGVESIKQQVCDYLVVTLLEPLYQAKTGFYQVACVKGKGQRLCRGALRRWVREGGYHVKLDVRKCYPSTAHDVVMRIYRRWVGSADVLYVIESILATYDMGGLEIGSYFSTRTMQLVLSCAYHYVEGMRKERRGRSVPLVNHQIWHMDDILLMGRDKRNLKMAVRSLERYMRGELGLSLKPWKVCRTSDVEPLDLGGWVVREGRCTLRAGTFLRATRAFAEFRRRPSVGAARRCCSYWGWLMHGDCLRVRQARGIDGAMAHARRVVSRNGRLEGQHGPHTERHAA